MPNIENMPLFVSKVVFVVAILVASIIVGYTIAKWLKDYKIFQFIWASMRGKASEVDRIRRMQMREAYKDSSDIMSSRNGKPTIMQKFYRKISMSGIIGKIPGFSESAFLVVLGIVSFVLLLGLSFKFSFVAGIAITIIFNVLTFYLLSIAAYSRAIAVEDQMLDFVNLIASTSRQYSNIIDIFGVTYEKFRNPLRQALEECYVEAKQTNNLEQSLFHLKEKFDSTQFEFIIDNLLLCSKENGQYFDVATDLSKISNVYFSSFQKKKQILRQAKINLTVMLIISIGIVIMMGQFLGGGVRELVGSQAGIIITSLILLLYVYSMNMKAR